MKNLEKLYEIDFEKIYPYQRKVQISYPYTIVVGASKSGKSYLIYDYLKQYKAEQYLYINLNDIRFDTTSILYNLDRFLLRYKQIEILVLDNVTILHNKLFENLTHLKSIIISSTTELSLYNFKTLKLTPLDFEEYILFDRKHQNTTNSFNSFLKYGNFPEIVLFDEIKQLNRNQEILKLITANEIEFEILKLFINVAGEIKSIFQLFNTFKQTYKISKDIFYKTAKKFEQNNIIYFCPKFQSPKSPKTIYSYNHALIDAVTINKKFNNILSNMVFLELQKLNLQIYYLDNIEFYIEQQHSIILTIPFFNDYISLSKKILPTIENLHIKEITIITISTTRSIFIGEIECEVIPFYEWALSL